MLSGGQTAGDTSAVQKQNGGQAEKLKSGANLQMFSVYMKNRKDVGSVALEKQKTWLKENAVKMDLKVSCDGACTYARLC